MGLTIHSTNSTPASLKVTSGSGAVTGSAGRLSVSANQSDRTTVSTSVNAEDRARRSATLQLSKVASSLNTKQDLTEEQSLTVSSLLKTAREIKRETNPVRSASLAADATSLISSTTTQETAAIHSDPTLAQDSSVQITVDSEIPVGNSDRQFNVSVSKVSTLSSLGVSSSLSFSQANIDTTISTLESAESSLNSKLTSFDSTRTAISAEVSTRGESAGLKTSGSDSVDSIASRLAKNISSSLDSLLASSNIEKLDVNSLISESTSEELSPAPSAE